LGAATNPTYNIKVSEDFDACTCKTECENRGAHAITMTNVGKELDKCECRYGFDNGHNPNRQLKSYELKETSILTFNGMTTSWKMSCFYNIFLAFTSAECVTQWTLGRAQGGSKVGSISGTMSSCACLNACKAEGGNAIVMENNGQDEGSCECRRGANRNNNAAVVRHYFFTVP